MQYRMENKINSNSLERLENIVKKIENNYYTAVWYSELLSRAVFEEDISMAFGKSIETWGLNLITQGLHDALVSTLMRILDKGMREEGANTASLFTLQKSLEDPEICRELERRKLIEVQNREVNVICDPSISKEMRDTIIEDHKETDVHQAIESLQTGLGELDDLINKINGDIQHARVRSHRVISVAHQVLDRDEKTQPFAQAKDVHDLVIKLAPIVQTAVLVVTSVGTDPEDYIKKTKDISDKFWKFASQIELRDK